MREFESSLTPLELRRFKQLTSKVEFGVLGAEPNADEKKKINQQLSSKLSKLQQHLTPNELKILVMQLAGQPGYHQSSFGATN